MTLSKTSIALLLAAVLSPQGVTTVSAQNAPPPPAAQQAPQRAFTQAELDQMLAPIALYPDALLSQVLMAATYPIEVVEAARWSRANPGLQGDAAVRAVQNEDWDPSVKSLVAFPQILQRMDEQLKWTESLGDAFLAQEPAVMDTVQQLRRRAQAAGNLQSTEQIRVQQQGQTIVVQSPPEVVYVPYYDPLIVYGPWWWPAYRPVVWAPWPGYARPRPGVTVGLWFGAPIGLSASFFFGDFDWGRRHVQVVRPSAYYYRPPTVVVNRTTVINRNVTVERNAWQHDPHHRRGVEYRAPEVRQQFASAQARPPAQPQPQRQQQQEQQRQQRVQPQVRQEQRAEPRPQPQPQAQPQPQPQPQARQEHHAVPHPKPQPQVQTEQRAEPRPQPQARPEPHAKPQAPEKARPPQRDEQRPERREAQQDSQGGRGGERSERGNGKGGGERS
jgi:hypothetical protein